MRLLQAIRAGHHRQSAAALAGISPATLFRYLSSDDESCRRLQAAIEKAEADLEATILEAILDHIPDDPRLGLSLLERRFPSRWGRGRDETSVRAGEPSLLAPSPINVLVVDPARVEEAAQRRLQRSRQGDSTSAAVGDLVTLPEGGDEDDPSIRLGTR